MNNNPSLNDFTDDGDDITRRNPEPEYHSTELAGFECSPAYSPARQPVDMLALFGH